MKKNLMITMMLAASLVSAAFAKIEKKEFTKKTPQIKTEKVVTKTAIAPTNKPVRNLTQSIDAIRKSIAHDKTKNRTRTAKNNAGQGRVLEAKAATTTKALATRKVAPARKA